jgi:uncharacterized protein (TIGR03435 family)
MRNSTCNVIWFSCRTFGAIALILEVPAGSTQPLGRPQFEVVSLKPNPGCKNNGGVISPGRLEWSCITLDRLVHNAYVTFADGKKISLNDIEIVGAPSWTRFDTFSLAAKAEGAAPLPVMAGPMLQILLEDRFKLRIRHATKEAPVYALMPAKRGMKLQRTKEGSCVSVDLQHSSNAIVRPSPPNGAICGNVYTKASGSSLTMDAHATSGANFAVTLSDFVDRPVIDKTGFTEPFDVHLEFARAEAPVDSSVLSIFDALEQQLGLKLVAVSAPVEYLIVEHVERLSDPQR